jgi:hypothetical protein
MVVYAMNMMIVQRNLITLAKARLAQMIFISTNIGHAILLTFCHRQIDPPVVTIICRYIFLRFRLKIHFASTKFCDLYVEMVQGRQILTFYTTMVLIANDCGYKILRFWANPQKYQTLVPAKNSHLKVTPVRFNS